MDCSYNQRTRNVIYIVQNFVIDRVLKLAGMREGINLVRTGAAWARRIIIASS